VKLLRICILELKQIFWFKICIYGRLIHQCNIEKIIFIAVFSCFQLLGFAQWNTERILTIGRNALYFEDYVLSIQYFNQVIKIKPYLAEPYMYRAMAKIQLGDDKGAETDATEAIERNPFCLRLTTFADLHAGG